MSARGEQTIRVGQREIVILFTNRALLSAEKQLNKGILGILDGFASGSSGINDLIALLRSGMEAARQDARSGGKPVSNEDALAVIDEIGFVAALTPVMEAVAMVISYAGDSAISENGADPNT